MVTKSSSECRGKTERRSAKIRQVLCTATRHKPLPADANLLIYDDKLIGEMRQDSESPNSEMKIRNLRSGLQSTMVPIKEKNDLKVAEGFLLGPIGLMLPRALSALVRCSTNARLGQQVIHGICRRPHYFTMHECAEMLGINYFLTPPYSALLGKATLQVGERGERTSGQSCSQG